MQTVKHQTDGTLAWEGELILERDGTPFQCLARPIPNLVLLTLTDYIHIRITALN